MFGVPVSLAEYEGQAVRLYCSNYIVQGGLLRRLSAAAWAAASSPPIAPITDPALLVLFGSTTTWVAACLASNPTDACPCASLGGFAFAIPTPLQGSDMPDPAPQATLVRGLCLLHCVRAPESSMP